MSLLRHWMTLCMSLCIHIVNFTAEYELTRAGHNISTALMSKNMYKDQEHTITYNEETGSNVSLICSSGLTGDDSGTSCHIQVQFVF